MSFEGIDCLQLNLLPLPKTENQEHMKNNAASDFQISEEDMNKLKSVTSDFDYGKSNDRPVFRKVLG
ncbi:hypothetical protein [Enterococcus sp. AZ128]|uniref:hypothetical protein n=1 Tax=unclassified Enterococcus TaxID=2608891 RepID=UPI003F683F3D